jgi:hypothetical protein
LRYFISSWSQISLLQPQIHCFYLIILIPKKYNNNNSIRDYLRANLTAQRPITKLARVHRNTQKYLKEQNTKYDSLYKGQKLIIIVIKGAYGITLLSVCLYVPSNA